MRLLPGGQFERISQGRAIFVHEKARWDRGDFVEHATRLAKIDRLEVLAVQDLRYRDPESHKLLATGKLVLRGGDAHGHVVNGPEAIPCSRRFRRMHDLELAARSTTVDGEPGACLLGPNPLVTEHVRQEAEGALRLADAKGDAVQTPDRDGRITGTSGCRASQILPRSDQLDLEPGWIFELEDVLAEPRGEIRRRHPGAPQPAPPCRKRSRGDGERGLGDLPGSLASNRNSLPFVGEGRKEGAGRPDVVAIIEMKDVAIVEVDGFLDQSEPQQSSVEIQILLGIVHRCRNVMKTLNEPIHGALWSRPNPNYPDRTAVNQPLRFLRARFDRQGHLGLHLTIGFLISLAALLGFVFIAREVVAERALTRVDLDVQQWLRGRSTQVGFGVWSVVSSLGGGPAILVIGLGVSVLLALRRRGMLLGGWITALAGGGILDGALKWTFQRPRPETAAEILGTASWSFPSGHALVSLVTYGMLAYVILVAFTPSKPVRVWIAVGFAMLVLAIGTSRLYLGVHYFSDVLGGFAAGGLWLSACASGLEVARRLRTASPGPASPPSNNP